MPVREKGQLPTFICAKLSPAYLPWLLTLSDAHFSSAVVPLTCVHFQYNCGFSDDIFERLRYIYRFWSDRLSSANLLSVYFSCAAARMTRCKAVDLDANTAVLLCSYFKALANTLPDTWQYCSWWCIRFLFPAIVSICQLQTLPFLILCFCGIAEMIYGAKKVVKFAVGTNCSDI